MFRRGKRGRVRPLSMTIARRPYGAKGVGEPPCIQPPAAIANAIAAATGVRIQSLPITTEKIALARLKDGD